MSLLTRAPSALPALGAVGALVTAQDLIASRSCVAASTSGRSWRGDPHTSPLQPQTRDLPAGLELIGQRLADAAGVSGLICPRGEPGECHLVVLVVCCLIEPHGGGCMMHWLREPFTHVASAHHPPHGRVCSLPLSVPGCTMGESMLAQRLAASGVPLQCSSRLPPRKPRPPQRKYEYRWVRLPNGGRQLARRRVNGRANNAWVLYK
jgi:hypothetical protein